MSVAYGSPSDRKARASAALGVFVRTDIGTLLAEVSGRDPAAIEFGHPDIDPEVEVRMRETKMLHRCHRNADIHGVQL